jgi:hypothetical protein
VGTVFPGTIQAADHADFKPDETFTFHNSQSLLFKGSTDVNLLKILSVGICLNYVPIHIKDADNLGLTSNTVHMAEVDATFKLRFFPSRKLVLKPGIIIGYRQTFSSDTDAREKGFCFDSGFNCLYYLGANYFISAELGFFTQPYGGIEGIAYIRAWPIFYANMGFGISL